MHPLRGTGERARNLRQGLLSKALTELLTGDVTATYQGRGEASTPRRVPCSIQQECKRSCEYTQMGAVAASGERAG